MNADRCDRTSRYLATIEQAMLAELDQWHWDLVPVLRHIVETQIRRGGKRMRPLLALAFAELYGGDSDDVVVAATSVELYHLASLVLDDVQDNSALRGGKPAVHTTATTSTAINVAAVTRSLSYHPIHRSDRLTSDKKLRLHRELDFAATQLVLGQSIDIGWNGGWYAVPGDFPYRDMVRWKTGSLYGCATAMAAVACGADDDIDAAREFGVSFGSLFQGVNDYLDAFGDDQALRRPRFEDFRGGKLTGPLICLLDALGAAGRTGDAELVTRRLAERTANGRDWLLDLMDRYAVAEAVRADLSRQAVELCRLLPDNPPRGRTAAVADLIDTVLAPAGVGWRTAAANPGEGR
jgi:geranylgeranyl pyrophosphate synthase